VPSRLFAFGSREGDGRTEMTQERQKTSLAIWPGMKIKNCSYSEKWVEISSA